MVTPNSYLITYGVGLLRYDAKFDCCLNITV